MTTRDERRRARTPQASASFGQQADAALDVLALLDLAWHDCYGEPAPPQQVLDDMWFVSRGDLGLFASAAHLAVIDFRDLRLNADELRG